METMKNPPTLKLVAGLDEAGRGSWAGPVVAAAVILPEKIHLPGLNDSKLVTEKKREELFAKIIKSCPHGIGTASHEEVDQWGLLHATFLAFKRALEQLNQRPEELWIDGRDKFQFGIPHVSVIKGDRTYRCIAAASILAKVTRDHLMIEWAGHYPDYGFEEHKGYGTEQHQAALRRLGPSAIHRKTYAPLLHLKWAQEAFL